mmetsp:Transcript_15841/g.24104  ORF Transcript_15841/g.24104 Transcript_15841/m.24104 type:complete len:130 (+) Transcript_15841:1466-1855(+)
MTLPAISASDKIVMPASVNLDFTIACVAGVLACGFTNTKAEFFIFTDLSLVAQLLVNQGTAKTFWTKRASTDVKTRRKRSKFLLLAMVMKNSKQDFQGNEREKKREREKKGQKEVCHDEPPPPPRTLCC